MTPERALNNLDMAASTASLSREQHVAIQASVKALADFIAANTDEFEEDSE
jgi:hypothetical protein